MTYWLPIGFALLGIAMLTDLLLPSGAELTVMAVAGLSWIAGFGLFAAAYGLFWPAPSVAATSPKSPRCN